MILCIFEPKNREVIENSIQKYTYLGKKEIILISLALSQNNEIENFVSGYMLMQNTTQKPLKWKRTGPIDKSGKFHSA